MEEQGSNSPHPQICREQVKTCLESILLRTPGQDLVDYHVNLGFESVIQLAEYLRSTDEYRASVEPAAILAPRQSLFLGDRIYTITHNGDRIYLIHDDLDLTPTILETGTWEPHVEQAIRKAVQPGCVAIEAGANVGYHTLIMANAVGKAGAVHAFEANPLVMKLLRATMIVNGHCDFRGRGRVNLYGEAATAKKGSLILQFAPGHLGSGHLVTDMPSSDFGEEYSSRHEVPAVRIDDRLKDLARVDFIHLDIEGAEPMALTGAEKLIDRSPGVKMILEWSADMIGAMGSVEDAVSWLESRDFHFWRIDESNGGYQELSVSDMTTLPRSDVYVAKRAPH